MPVIVKYKDKEFKITVDHEELIQEVKKDILEFGSSFQAYAVCEKISVKVPFTDDYVKIDCVVDYQFVVEDLTDLAENEHAVKTTLSKLLKRLMKENSEF